MIEATNFLPEWASPPGATISDLLEDQRRSIDEFAHGLGCNRKDTTNLLNGSLEITRDLADTISQLLGGTADFWLAREQQYRDSLTRLETSKQWLSEIPVADMVRYGWIKKVKDAKDKVSVCLDYFDVSTVSEWYEKYEGSAKLAAFRTSATLTSEEGSVLTWIRKGEIEAEKIVCNDWNRESFEEVLPNIRALTREKDPEVFLPALTKLCAECGVAVVVARAPSGCRASGVTKFITPEKALMMLSFRFLSDDHFWFTFFHEAGHLILHEKNALFLEGNGFASGDKESEANEFSANVLVPREHQGSMHALPLNARAVMRFARSIGISPGIVVGQLQHSGKFTVRQLNKLKTRYSWK